MPYFSAQQFPTFQQGFRLVSAITNAANAAVTTTFPHQYGNGLIVRLIVPSVYGMVQANNLTGTVTVTSPTTFTLDIDTRTFDTFTYPGATPPPGTRQAAQVIPIGEINSILDQAFHNALPY